MANTVIKTAHYPSNYEASQLHEEPPFRISLQPVVTPDDDIATQHQLDKIINYHHMVSGIKRLEILCPNSERWTENINHYIDQHVSKSIPLVIIRLSDQTHCIEAIIVRNSLASKPRWRSSFTSYIDSYFYDERIFCSLDNLEIVDLRGPFNPGGFDSKATDRVGRKIHSLISSPQFAAVRTLALPLDIMPILPGIMGLAGQSRNLHTLDLHLAGTIEGTKVFQRMDGYVEKVLFKCLILKNSNDPKNSPPFLKKLIFPLELASAIITRRIVLETKLSEFTLKRLVNDSTINGEESASLFRDLHGAEADLPNHRRVYEPHSCIVHLESLRSTIP